MRISFRFQFSDAICLSDCWPIEVDDAVYLFEEPIESSRGIVVTLRNQPVDLSPEIDTTNQIPSIRTRHDHLVPRIIERLNTLESTLSLLFPITLDTNNYEIRWIPESESEKDKIVMSKLSVDLLQRKTNIPFNLAAKGIICKPWPSLDSHASEFIIRGYRNLFRHLFIDSFVNFYFFFELLYARGKFRRAQVVKNFGENEELCEAYLEMIANLNNEKEKCDAPLTDVPTQFFNWMVERRGFFQHQSERNPNRWLLSEQSIHAPDAHLLADLAQRVYWKRNSHRVFNKALDENFFVAAKKVHAVMNIIVEILGDGPDGRPIRDRLNIEIPGRKLNHRLAGDILERTINISKERLIDIRQMTAFVSNTNQMVFSYVGPADSNDE